MIIKARNLRIAALAASLTLLLTAFGMSEAVRAADSSSPTLKLPVPRINTANRKKFRSHIQRAWIETMSLGIARPKGRA
ncbi:MAG: hypothetical protein R3F53_03965 [Gammaproteobacteria bacterium]